MKKKNGDFLRVVFIFLVTADHFQLLRLKPAAPVTVLTCIFRGTEVRVAGRDGPVIRVERKCKELTNTRQLVMHEPCATWPDMTIHTFHPGMRRVLIGG